MAVDLKPYDFPQVIRSVFEVEDNCLRVKVINSSGSGGELEVLIDHTEDSIRLGDGTGFFTSTVSGPKRSLDVNVTSPITITDTGIVNNVYGEVNSLVSGLTAVLVNFTATSNCALQIASASGDNIAEYWVEVNSSVQSRKRTYFSGDFNVDFDFKKGIPLVSGDVVEVKVVHNRPTVADFNANLVIVT